MPGKECRCIVLYSEEAITGSIQDQNPIFSGWGLLIKDHYLATKGMSRIGAAYH
jgi:hypothetical protein